VKRERRVFMLFANVGSMDTGGGGKNEEGFLIMLEKSAESGDKGLGRGGKEQRRCRNCTYL